MEFDFRKPIIALIILIAVWHFISSRYTPQDVLRYAHQRPKLSIGPALDYYIGMGYYIRSDYDKSSEAFVQLLTDYTTTQYTAKALFYAGEINEDKMRWADARNFYQQYADRFPGTNRAKIVEKRLQELKFK